MSAAASQDIVKGTKSDASMRVSLLVKSPYSESNGRFRSEVIADMSPELMDFGSTDKVAGVRERLVLLGPDSRTARETRDF